MKPISSQQLKLHIDAYLLDKLQENNQTARTFYWSYDKDRKGYVKVSKEIGFDEWRHRMIYLDPSLNYVIERTLSEMTFFPDAEKIIDDINKALEEKNRQGE